MNAKHSRRTGRPRLDASERARLLAEIAKLGASSSADVEAQSAAIRLALSADLPRPDDNDETADRANAPKQTPAPRVDPAPGRADIAWGKLRTLTVDPDALERNLVITAKRTDPAHGAFDVLRTRLVQALAENGWRRVAITSPTAGCGKSFTAMNLAVTLSRYDQSRTILMDMDLRRPRLAQFLDHRHPASIGNYLRGRIDPADFFARIRSDGLNIGANLAIGLNGFPEDFAAELFQQPTTGRVLAETEDIFDPEVVLFDLPPALAQDDVIAFRPHFDCVLMVVGGGITTAEEVREAQRRIGEDKPLLGVVLNKAEIEGDYAY